MKCGPTDAFYTSFPSNAEAACDTKKCDFCKHSENKMPPRVTRGGKGTARRGSGGDGIIRRTRAYSEAITATGGVPWKKDTKSNHHC